MSSGSVNIPTTPSSVDITPTIPMSQSPHLCFICKVDLDNPETVLDKREYPSEAYAALFNSLGQVLGGQGSLSKDIFHLSPQIVLQKISYCKACHAQVWQLDKLSNSENKHTRPVKDRITFLEKMIKFKFAFAKRSRPKLMHMFRAQAAPSEYSTPAYWYLQDALTDCLRNHDNAEKLNEILKKIDMQKISSVSSKEEDSLYRVVSWPGADLKSETFPLLPAHKINDDVDDFIFNKASHPGSVASAGLKRISVGSHFSKAASTSAPVHQSKRAKISELKTPSGKSDIFTPGESLVPSKSVSEESMVDPLIKPPRKQVLASRVGVSTGKPILKTILRDALGNGKIIDESDYHSGEIISNEKRRSESEDFDIFHSSYSGDADFPDFMEDGDGVGKHICSICKKTFSTRQRLMSHVYSHRKPYCSLCRQYFQDVEAFNTHKSSKHGSGPEECFVCKQKFSDPEKLLSHYRIHKNTKTYRCSYVNCTESFMSKVESIAHLRDCKLSTGNADSSSTSPSELSAVHEKRQSSSSAVRQNHEKESTDDDSS